MCERSGGACGTRSGAVHASLAGRWRLGGAGRHEADTATYVLERDDVRVLAVPQEDLDLFRGVAFALIDDLEQTGAVRPWLGLCPPLRLAAAEGPAVSRMLAAARCARLHRPAPPVPRPGRHRPALSPAGWPTDAAAPTSAAPTPVGTDRTGRGGAGPALSPAAAVLGRRTAACSALRTGPAHVKNTRCSENVSSPPGPPSGGRVTPASCLHKSMPGWRSPAVGTAPHPWPPHCYE